MEGENDKLINGTDAANGEATTPLFSAFRPKPRPAPAKVVAPPSPKPAPAEKPPAATAMDARLAGLEQKLQEAAEKESARGSDKEMLNYLKVKTAELEGKLRESQEKGLAFAYELKGREDARKESRREMEEFLAAVKQQQSTAEAERLQAMELKKSRERIEALEARLLELSTRPPAPPDAGQPARIEELADKISSISARLDAVAKAGVTPEEAGKLRALLKSNIAEVFGPLARELESKILKTVEKNFDARMEREFSDLKKSKEELRLLINSIDNSAEGFANILSGCVGEIRESIRELSPGAAAAGIGADREVEWVKALMEKNGRAAADKMAGSYNMGFLQASLDNLEKCLSSAIDNLAHEQTSAEETPGLPNMPPEMRKRWHLAALKSAIRSLKNGLSAFRGIRPGMVKQIKRDLTGE